MRVLFFAEPFPVRARPLDFDWVVCRWLALARELAMCGAVPLFAVSDAIKAAHSEESFLLLSPADFGVRYALPETAEAVDADWMRLMSEPDEPTWRPFVEALLDRARPDAIVTWTMNGPLRAAAAARRLVLLHQELGPMRPPNPMLYFTDPVGVNGESSLPEVWPVLREQPLAPADEQELNGFLSHALAPSPIPRDETARRLALVPGRHVLAVFLQMSRDQNLLRWTRVRGNRGLLELIARAAHPAEFHVLVKPHPGEPELPETAGGAHLQPTPPDLPNEALFEVVDAVLTVSSSVGFEALARGKVVYTFGGSPYAERGCTRDLGDDPEALRRSLAEPFALSAEEDLYRRRLLHFMLFRYLVPESEMWDPRVLIQRLQRWRRLLERGAPRLEWFSPEPAAVRLQEVCAQRLESG